MNSSEEADRRIPTPPRLVSIVAALLLVLQLLVTLVAYPFLPNVVPSHVNAAGHIDAYLPKWIDVIIMPAISLATYLLLWTLLRFLPVIPSKYRNVRDLRLSQRILGIVLIGVMSVMFLVQLIVISVALSK